MRQHNIWCVDVCSVWGGMPDCKSGIPPHTEHTSTHQMLCCRVTTLTFYILTNFKISDFNKEYTSSLRMI